MDPVKKCPENFTKLLTRARCAKKSVFYAFYGNFGALNYQIRYSEFFNQIWRVFAFWPGCAPSCKRILYAQYTQVCKNSDHIILELKLTRALKTVLLSLYSSIEILLFTNACSLVVCIMDCIKIPMESQM